MIEFEVTGIPALQTAFQEMQRRLEPAGLSTFLADRVDTYLRDRIEARFTTEGDAASGKWAGLRRVTAVIRASRGFPAYHPINRRTGELTDFVANTSDVSTSGGGVTLTKPRQGGSRELQNKLRNAQMGGVSSAGNAFPARPVLAMGDQDAAAILNRLSDYLTEAIAMAAP